MCPQGAQSPILMPPSAQTLFYLKDSMPDLAEPEKLIVVIQAHLSTTWHKHAGEARLLNSWRHLV